MKPLPLLAWFFIAIGALTASAGTRPLTITSDPLFDGPILRWEIQLSRAELQKLRRTGWGPGGNRPEAIGNVRVGTNLFTQVTLKLKGAAGSFRPVDDNPALTLNFGKAKDGQTCFGHRKLHLNNSVQDGSLMNELVCSEMYLAAGVPTPRASHAYVTLNGRDLGVYVLKGGWDKPFLKQHFGSAKGNFYDGGFVQDIYQNLERDSGEGEPDWADLEKLRAAVNRQDPESRAEAAREILDVDRFLTFTAIQVIMDDWDGYCRNHNNYRIYSDPTSQRLVFLPHGMDQLLREPNSTFRPRFKGVAASRLFAVPAIRNQLIERINELTNSVFNSGFMLGSLSRAERRLMASLREEDRDERIYISSAISDFRGRIERRLAAFSGLSVARTVKFDAESSLAPDQWRPQREGTGADLEQRDGAFVITATGPQSVGSWRSHVELPAGRYRFEARARCRGVVATQDGRGGGVGIRVSQKRRQGGMSGDSDWRTITYEFEVNPEADSEDNDRQTMEIILVAELRASAGDAEFDPASFRLKRL
jgi:spore coat protein H